MTRALQKVGKWSAERWVFRVRRLQKNCQRRCRRHDVVHVDSSRHEQRRPGKLGRRQSTTVYDGRSVMITLIEDEGVTPICKLQFFRYGIFAFHLNFNAYTCTYVYSQLTKNKF